MPSILLLLKRYSFPRRNNLLGLALWISVAGVVLGIVQLVVVLAVMSGFLDLFRINYTRISSEIVVIPRHRSLHQEAFQTTISQVPGVQAVSPAGLAQAMVIGKGGIAGVVLEGVDRKTTSDVTPWKQIWRKPPDAKIEKDHSYWIWLGEQLAKKLNVGVGDRVEVMVADSKTRKVIPFVVSAIVKFGIYDHDLRYARIDLGVLNEMFRRFHLEPFYKTKVKAGLSIAAVAADVRKELGQFATVKQWSDINQNVFLAVEHQKRLLFFILEILVGLAAVNVVSLLLMSAHQKRRDIAILRTMGMRVWKIVGLFVMQGAMVGALGVSLGVILGYAACAVLRVVQPSILSEAVYNVSKLPLDVRTRDVALIAGVGFLVCVLFSFLPALRAALRRPVDALRYE